MIHLNASPARGILNFATAPIHLTRRQPSPAIGCFVSHFWIVQWDLRGQPPHTQETLPHPTIHLAFEPHQSAIYGIVTGKFTRRIEEKGHVVGIAFHPGAFYPFIQSSVGDFADKTLPPSLVFGADYRPVESALRTMENPDEMIALVEQFLLPRLPAWDENIGVVGEMMACIKENPHIKQVQHLTHEFHLSQRTIQRLFYQYVGVYPKWVIQRYRLHEAIEQMTQETDSGEIEWSRLAVELGYYDQAHFIKDFKMMVGKTPAEYAKSLSPTPA